jgi:hypothetical protein
VSSSLTHEVERAELHDKRKIGKPVALELTMAKKNSVKSRQVLSGRKTYPDDHTDRDLILDQASAGFRGRIGKPFSSAVSRKLAIQFAFLTAAQWKDIQKGTDFPNGVRHEINIALQNYWSDRLVDPVALKDEIVKAREKLKDAADALDKLVRDGSMFQGVIEGYERTYSEQRLDLETALEWMSVSADHILADAEKRFSVRRGTPAKYGRLKDLVYRLDAILIERSPRKVDQSKVPIIPKGITPLQFVWMVAQVADPEVSMSRVTKVASDYARDMKRAEIRQRDSGNELPFERTKIYDSED